MSPSVQDTVDGAWQGWTGTPSLQQPMDLGKIFLFDDFNLYKPKENNTGLRLQQPGTLRSSLPGQGLLRLLLNDLGSPFPVHYSLLTPKVFPSLSPTSSALELLQL